MTLQHVIKRLPFFGTRGLPALQVNRGAAQLPALLPGRGGPLRINLIAGPGRRKSWVWKKLGAALQEDGIYVETVHEVAKKHVLQLKTNHEKWLREQLANGETSAVPPFKIGWATQMIIFNEQYAEELVRLEAGAEVVLNEGCPFVSYCHAAHDPELISIRQALSDQVTKLDRQFPRVLNLLLEPPANAAYDAQGRYQDQAAAAALHAAEHEAAWDRYRPEQIGTFCTDDIAGMLDFIHQAAAMPAAA